MTEKYQIRRYGQSQQQNMYFDAMERIGNVTKPSETSFELDKVPDFEIKSFNPEAEYNNLVLFSHPSGRKEWKKCKIIN